ncbi:YesL family protein [Clostridium nigeriense]|uniref:YesL family protein n=1 Tax=Clostridium nigeriense TaxID=1805470 RepID=UPI003D33F0A5
MSGNREYLSSKIFNLDNGIMRFFSRIFDIVILNFTFIICCIPIFTIGASLTAMYSITLKMVRNEESHIIRGFLKAFKQNFKQGTVVGMIAIIITLFITVDLRIIGIIGDDRLKVLQVLCYIVAIWAYVIFLYAFPLLARFKNTTKEVFKNSFILSVINFKWTILLILLNIPFVLMLFYSGLSMFLLFTILIICGFSGLALIQSFIFYKVFEKYENYEEV